MFDFILSGVNQVWDALFEGLFQDAGINSAENTPPINNEKRFYKDFSEYHEYECVSKGLYNSKPPQWYYVYKDKYSEIAYVDFHILDVANPYSLHFSEVFERYQLTIPYRQNVPILDFGLIKIDEIPVLPSNYIDTGFYQNQKTRKYQIGCEQTIKVRKIMEKNLRYFGYPIREYASMDYFSGVAMFVPNDCRVSVYKTNQFWRNYENAKWRYVILEPEPLEGSSIDYIADMLTSTPWVGKYVNEAVELLYRTGAFHYPIFINLAFFDTLNDLVIRKNWDFCCQLLNMWGN